MFDTNEYTENGIRFSEEVTPLTYVEVQTYCSGFIPWDVDGMMWANRYRKVLENAGLHPIVLRTRRKIIGARGTGPGGALRLGDNMLPDIYRIAVPQSEESQAQEAIRQHKQAISAWLNEDGPMPVEYRD